MLMSKLRFQSKLKSSSLWRLRSVQPLVMSCSFTKHLIVGLMTSREALRGLSLSVQADGENPVLHILVRSQRTSANINDVFQAILGHRLSASLEA